MKTLNTFFVIVALISGLVGCTPAPTPTEYNLIISSTEGGLVTTPGEGTGSFTYDEGEVVDIVAEAEEGYHFDNWIGDVGTVANVNNATTTIIMSSHYSITANFARGPAIPLRNPGDFVQMTLGDVWSLDPAWSYDFASGEQVQYIYETLLFYDGEEVDEFVPVLATEWELLEDSVTYRFKIRDGVKFHEGGTLTPEDVEYSFERVMVQDIDGGPACLLYQPLLGLGDVFSSGSRDEHGNIQVTFDQIDNAVEVDGDWVVFHLIDRSWDLAFLQILSGPWASSIVDKEWCIANGEWDGTKETWEDYNNPDVSDSYLYNHTNGTGPWKLEEWEQGIQIKLVRNDDYWRGPPAFEKVITKFVEEWATRKAALLGGDVDLVYVPPANIGELEGISDLEVCRDLPTLDHRAFLFNFDITSNSTYIGSGALDGNGISPDFFTDIDVRKGFCYAFDYETFIEDGWLGEAQQLGSPVCEGLPYFNPDAPMYSLDLAKAEQHLKLAWNGEVWNKGFKFTLLYNSGNAMRETACRILAENLAKINARFQVSIQPMNWQTGIFPGIKSGLVPMFLAGWGGDYPHPNHFVVPFMASYGRWAEFQGYGCPELDELIEGAFKELDPAVQQDMYYEIQERYYEDAPGIMLVQPLERRYFTKYIEGFYWNPAIPGQVGPLYYMSKSSS
jgi:peptide/nickel transport system substrate-binding protein